MNRYTVQIQNCIDVEIDANSKEEARGIVIENLEDYKEEMINTCTVHEPFIKGIINMDI